MTAKPRVVSLEDAPSLVALGIEHRLRLTGADTDGTLTLVEVTIPQGLGIPPHVHTREDELFHVLDGAVDFTVDGRLHRAASGMTFFGPRGVPHSFTAGTGGARLLVTIYPSGLERMFEELSKLPPGPPDVQRLAAIVGQYGISFAG
jgi:quercetin dioxygenase-like cupin family protein